MTSAGTARAQIALVATVALVGLNLRPFIAAVGPLAGPIQAESGLGLQGVALLTLVPMFLMGVVAFVGPALQNALGARRAVLLSLMAISIGCAARQWLASGWGLVGTAALIGLGVAIVQAVFPGLVKQAFAPRHVGPMMGLYSAMLMTGGALGAVLAPVIAGATGHWASGLSWFAVPAVCAVLLAGVVLHDGSAGSARRRLTVRQLLGRPRTWLLMLSFGLINGGYSSVIAWLAPAYQALGWSAARSGSLLAVMAVSQACSALTLPVLARKQQDRRPWLWFTMAMQMLGFAGLAFMPGAVPLLWVCALGVGLGGCFALWLIVALDHLPDPAQAGALSAVMQGGGFLLAAFPPWLVAALHDATGGYAAGWCWHLACVALVAILVWRFAPRGYAQAMGDVGGPARAGAAA